MQYLHGSHTYMYTQPGKLSVLTFPFICSQNITKLCLNQSSKGNQYESLSGKMRRPFKLFLGSKKQNTKLFMNQLWQWHETHYSKKKLI